ncbi:M23 family metallopeptidase [Geodermatophilus ruber]|uniref:Peptidase family M23 n=1 Tax=Geodermatophilus ruber TaxID=504800 RepID=A0A1I4DUL8_9ACTN|nr:M23 family metallopeptidase [Geodermatophilus ruber]SFK96743.1 Peptidase family M23 [Geodermatophilus ruber]
MVTATAAAARAAGRGRPRPAEELAEVTDLAGLTGQAEAAALAGIEGLPEGRTAHARPAPGSGGAPGARHGLRRRRPVPPPASRRPAMYLAAALVGAVGLGLVTTDDRVAQADSTEAGSHSVSVAQELGLDGGSQAAAIESDAAARLGEMTASRTAREAEQAAAAQVQAEADRLAAEAAAEAARPDAVLPVAGARLTSGFGLRWGTMHSGIDLAAPMRTPEYAAMDGIVLEAGPASGYGLAVYLQHENGDVTVYGHMDEILVQPGQVVRAGDTIALLGNRGQSTGPHLHFEVHVGGLNGQKIDPLPWLRERGVAI